MAIVSNLALNGDNNPGATTNTDQAFNSASRSNGGEPNGSLTPAFVGEIVLDTTNNMLWKAVNVANTDWVPLTSSGGTL
jgi:hypothetical protein